jgi:hypothetical protein
MQLENRNCIIPPLLGTVSRTREYGHSEAPGGSTRLHMGCSSNAPFHIASVRRSFGLPWHHTRSPDVLTKIALFCCGACVGCVAGILLMALLMVNSRRVPRPPLFGSVEYPEID